MTKKLLLFVGAFALLTSLFTSEFKKEGAETPPEPWTIQAKNLVEIQQPNHLTAPTNVAGFIDPDSRTIVKV